VVQSSEEKDCEETLADGTLVRRKVITTKHVRPATTIVRQVNGCFNVIYCEISRPRGHNFYRAVLAVALCLSVCPSVASRSFIETAGWIKLASHFRH